MAIEERDLQLLLKALAFAARKHKDQRRKDVDASPYINHPISLANILINEAHVTDIAVICAALLHDTVEDTDTTPEELEREFGVAIRDLVMAVTDDKTLPPHVRKERQVAHASEVSPQAKLVKLADKISNVRDMTDAPPAAWDLARREAYIAWAKAVVDQLRGTHPALEAAFDAAFSNTRAARPRTEHEP